MTGYSEQSSFLYGANATYVAELYTRYLSNPASVDQSWAGFFADLNEDGRAILDELRGASWAPCDSTVIGQARGGDDMLAHAAAQSPALMAEGVGALPTFFQAHQSVDQVRSAIIDSLRAFILIRIYRVRGHLEARLDPLGLEKREPHPELDPANYGFGPGDWDRPIFINYAFGLESVTLRQLMDILRSTYCGTIGVEYMHIQDPEQKAWIQERIETIKNHTNFTVNGKRAILERLTAAEGFERFLQMKYTGTKRFGLDGGESLIPALEQIIKRGGQLGLKDVIIGMPHRGRLNVLTNFMSKPFHVVFSEFQGGSATPEDVQGSGDVKYHLGTSTERDFDGHVVSLALTANPSHLEAVNPVVLGKVRCKQMQREDHDRTQVAGLCLHGDAAFAGQGLVSETLLLSELKGYRTGGTLHFIVNNQIGFTTNPSYSRSGPYCTDVAKGIQAPIFHVNGDDPEAVVHVSRIAIEFRQKFKKDVVVDMFCYRRHGHNEGDEPAFTQPIMYKAIRKQPTTRELYARQLVNEAVITEAEGQQMALDFQKRLEKEYAGASSYKPNKADWLEGRWSGFIATRGEEDHRSHTSVDKETLREIGRALTRYPEGFDLNPKITRQLKQKEEMFESGEGFDWGTAEAMAFGSLLLESTPIRLSGQDSGRGTFSQRHSVFHDQSNQNRFIPLNHIRPTDQAAFEVHDSPLSEFAVLGFEYGFSLTAPYELVLWEGQFGDFANGAQTIIDQFISSGESKWLRMSGLVMLLPHGYEGQGPEHSSAHPERYLALCAEDNIQVCNISTPANYFHALRRQMRRRIRKPLVIFTPKSLLRHKLCVSKLSEFTVGTGFQRVIRDESQDLVAADKIKRVVLCTGKIYYELLQERDARAIKDVALVRVEQLYPLPQTPLTNELRKYSNAEVVWCQEEPENMGYWTFMDRRIEGVLAPLDVKAKRPSYVGRPASASPATGLAKTHSREQAKLVDEALTVK